jgi:hypothetical protein
VPERTALAEEARGNLPRHEAGQSFVNLSPFPSGWRGAYPLHCPAGYNYRLQIVAPALRQDIPTPPACADNRIKIA